MATTIETYQYRVTIQEQRIVTINHTQTVIATSEESAAQQVQGSVDWAWERVPVNNERMSVGPVIDADKLQQDRAALIEGLWRIVASDANNTRFAPLVRSAAKDLLEAVGEDVSDIRLKE